MVLFWVELWNIWIKKTKGFSAIMENKNTLRIFFSCENEQKPMMKKENYEFSRHILALENLGERGS